MTTKKTDTKKTETKADTKAQDRAAFSLDKRDRMIIGKIAGGAGSLQRDRFSGDAGGLLDLSAIPDVHLHG